VPLSGKKYVKHDLAAITGDDFLKNEGISEVHFIKIDVDGNDFNVLKGFQKTIENHQPVIQFEYSHWWESLGYSLLTAKSFFEGMNYTILVMDGEKLTEKLPSGIDKFFVTKNLIAFPNSLQKEFVENGVILK
jgi:hypothetical protein